MSKYPRRPRRSASFPALSSISIQRSLLLAFLWFFSPRPVPAQETNQALLSIHRGPDPGWIQLSAIGPSNQVYTLQVSSNFSAWHTLALTLNPPDHYPDVRSTNLSRRFYRALLTNIQATNDWKNQAVFPADPFRSPETGQSPEEIRWVKFAIPLEDPVRIYYQNSRQYLFHYDFATARLPGFLGLSPQAFDLVSLHPQAGQEILLGTLLHPPAPNDSEYGVQFVGLEPYSREQVRDFFRFVTATVSADPGVRAYYMPTFEQAEVARTNQEWFVSQGVELASTSRWLRENQCYATGWALGRLRFVPAQDIAIAYRNGFLLPTDILLTDGVPAEMPFLAGIITLAPATPNSHAVILARSYGVPFVHLPDPLDQQRVLSLVDHKIGLRVVDRFTGCEVKVFDLENQLTPELEAALLDLKTPPEINFPPKARLGAPAVSTEALRPEDIRFVGGKAAHYGLLRQNIPAHSRFAIAFTFDLWDDFLDQSLPAGPSLRAEIQSRLNGLSYPPPLSTLASNLAEIRDLIRSVAVFTPQQQQAITNALLFFDPAQKIRFRSSTNVEDSESFTGAGLYDSYSGCLLDDLDGDEIGPSACDPSEPDERGVFRAMKKVYASFYNENAFLERLRHGIDETQVGMGILVHHSFPDEFELANGVAALDVTPSGSVPRINGDLVTQKGSVPVTNPDGTAAPEVVYASQYSFGTFLNLNQRSSLVPLGAHVLDWESDYRQLMSLFNAVALGYARVFTNKARFTLDFEYKKIEPGDLVVKQVREIPLPAASQMITPFLLHQTNQFCVFQGEYGDVFSNHRLKSQWSFQSRNLQLTEAHLVDGLYEGVAFEVLETTNLVDYTGPFSSLDNARQTVDGDNATNSWTLGAGPDRRDFALLTVMRREVPRSESPLFCLEDFALYLQATYATPQSVLDWQGNPALVTNDFVQLIRCPAPEDARLLQERFLTNDTVVIRTRFWWPEEPRGIAAGYTAPLAKWEETVITGLTTQPIILHGFYSQTYRPGHHNITEDFIFEPRLEPGLDPALLAELQTRNIQWVHVTGESLNTPMHFLGLDGKIRTRP